MFAALGIVAAELLTGKDGMQQLGLGALGRARTRKEAGVLAGGSAVARPARTAALKAATEDAPPPPPPFDPSKQVGAMAPMGFFDPLGFSNVGDKEGFRNLRAAELKHGRVAMMAAVGAVAQHYIKFPGFEKVPAGLAAATTPPGIYGLAALFLLSGVMELAVWTQDPKKEVGNFGDPVGLGMYNEDMRNKELNNGRMAMFAALGIISADLLTGKDGMQQLGLGALGRAVAPKEAAALAGVSAVATSTLSAVARNASAADAPPPPPPFDPSKQIGAMDPLGFFDPLGFSKVGDKDGFRNLRMAELKHGRVAMMAAVGAVAQHYIKFPGFEKVPAGLAAVTTAPGTYGLAALFLLSG